MKVLIVTTVELPDFALHYGHSISIFSGWVWQSILELKKKSSDIEIGVLISTNGIKYDSVKLNLVNYYAVSCISQYKYDHQCEINCRAAILDFNPDIIHINGTEFAFSLCVLNASNNEIPVVASIQGLASVYSRYIDGGIKSKDFIINTGIKDLMLRGTQRYYRKLMIKRGIIEVELIKKLSYIIGRTTWDRYHAYSINPLVKYYFCNETLRPIFYTKRWTFDDCEKYSIFVSNGTSALKGIHIVIKAFCLVKSRFPKSMLYIIGKDVFDDSNLKEILKRGAYQNYLRKLIVNLDLVDSIKFLGLLTEEEICIQFLKANVFVLPSCIENSPNSLGEAQIIGTPAIASYSGGVPDMIEQGKTGFMYRFEEYEMLSQFIIEVFKSGDCNILSENENNVASVRHNREVNSTQLYEIFKQIINKI